MAECQQYGCSMAEWQYESYEEHFHQFIKRPHVAELLEEAAKLRISAVYIYIYLPPPQSD